MTDATEPGETVRQTQYAYACRNEDCDWGEDWDTDPNLKQCPWCDGPLNSPFEREEWVLAK